MAASPVGYLKGGLFALFAAMLSIATFGQQPTKISLDEAVRLALENSPSIRAARTQIDQSRAQEITASLRPNPVLSWDSQFIPTFTPRLFSIDTVNSFQQFDMGVGYLFERGKKRQRRLDAARGQTQVTEAQVTDAERTLTFNVAQQFVNALFAESNLKFTTESLESFQKTVNINQDRYRAGDISKGDLLKIQLQLLQFQNDVNAARLARVQALASLRELIGYDVVSRNFDVEGDLAYQSVNAGLDDLQALALRQRPDLRATQLGVNAAQRQVNLAKANAKQDLNVSLNYSHLNDASTSSVFFNIPLPIFNRNQGEIARTRFAVTQAELISKFAHDAVLTDVRNAFEALKTSEQIVNLYQTGYLQQSQDSRDITEFAYRQGAAALLDFLDAERSYRSTQLAYRQSLASYMLASEQLRQAVGTRRLP